MRRDSLKTKKETPLRYEENKYHFEMTNYYFIPEALIVYKAYEKGLHHKPENTRQTLKLKNKQRKKSVKKKVLRKLMRHGPRQTNSKEKLLLIKVYILKNFFDLFPL